MTDEPHPDKPPVPPGQPPAPDEPTPGSAEAIASAEDALRERNDRAHRNQNRRGRRAGQETGRGLSPRVEAMARRMDTETLTELDRELIERVRNLQKLRAKGHTYDECAQIMGSFRGIVESKQRLLQFKNEGMYQYIAGVIEAAPDAATPAEEDPARQVAAVLRQSREDIAGLLPVAVEFLQDALKKGDDGKWVDPAQAEWAVQQLVKIANLDDAKDVAAPSVTVGTVKQVMHAVDDFDEQAERDGPPDQDDH